jgi:hypothetical protein
LRRGIRSVKTHIFGWLRDFMTEKKTDDGGSYHLTNSTNDLNVDNVTKMVRLIID